MSTTFQVYPTTAYIPQMPELLALANEKLHAFLMPLELEITPVIGVRIGEDIIESGSSSALTARWDADYAWFFVTPNEDGGGSDAYYRTVDELTSEMWEEYEDQEGPYADVFTSLSIGHYWEFRRSAGQPSIINATYGFLAAALAELTNGLIFSDDGAWSGPPIRAEEFGLKYFNPSEAPNYGKLEWYANGLEIIAETYKGKPYVSPVRLLVEHEWPLNERIRYAPSGRTLQEGPNEEDHLVVMHSEYLDFPYLAAQRNVVKADEQDLQRILIHLVIRGSNRIGRLPVKSIEEVERRPILEDRNLAFWANPLLVKDIESLRQQVLQT
ncbi:hypothetical protein [Paenibacillus xanthanilyticus]|uniref:DUF3396 domain-containing protein n=1 Tax=Paenibacillus xanthanilyticus TaxID=1783531 RepID=A0ABV8KDV9_9BACL